MRARVDLHNHSCLSPCADLEMSPAMMARTARARGIDILALTDHNAAHNCLPFALSCAGQGLVPLFGMEMSSAEEAHLLALFPSPRQALEFGAELHAMLPRLDWNPDAFGDQVVVDFEQRILEFHPVYLGTALDASFETLAEKAAAAGAIVIPAHVDRGMYSVHSQLGFLPPGPWDAVESIGPPPAHLSGGHAAISGSDAHALEQMGRRPFLVELPDAELRLMRRKLDAYIAECARRWGKAPAETGRDPEDSEDSEDEVTFGGYPELLADARLGLYPEAEAQILFESLRGSLRAGSVEAGFLPRPLVPERQPRRGFTPPSGP